jgi:hypothetical protein
MGSDDEDSREPPGPVWSARYRPFCLPDNLDDLRGPKATGRVTLPLHIHWSGPLRSFDLDDRQDR